MAVNVCPADRVQAPVEVVWELLMHPAGYGGFWEMTVEPEGPAAVGQRFFVLNEYSKAMHLHQIKASNSFLEVYVIPAIEIVEDLIKLNWSKIAKGALAVKKRKVELLEAEMKAPGRECAYVFEARKRFGI